MESIETRLSQLLRDYHPATLILLGDLVHDKNGAREFFSLVTRLREQCDVVLLAGNHDTQIKRLSSSTCAIPSLRIGSNSITAIANESKMGASRSSGIFIRRRLCTMARGCV